jgi:hypothetical protein
MQGILDRYPLERIVNMNETRRKLLNTGFLTVADRRSETLDCLFPGDPKICLTAIAAIDAGGGRIADMDPLPRNDDTVQTALPKG